MELDALRSWSSSRVGGRPILQVLPRGMRYSLGRATSIDLFVCELAAHSRFRVEIVAEAADPALPAAAIHHLPAFGLANTLRRARFVAGLAHGLEPAALIVQQHLPSAAAIRARVGAPVILQKHNFLRPTRRARWARGLSHWRHTRQLNSLAGLTFVSAAVMDQFERDWPAVTTPRRVIFNGVDLDAWRPAPVRAKTALIVGRATPEKGLIEAVAALRPVLSRHAEWSATFVVSEPARFPDYFANLCTALAPLGDRARLLVDLPFAEVKALNESAAIALIPSMWREPFGRTCLEAHAGGAAVISSGSGGLSEISGESALFLRRVDRGTIAEALEAMIGDERLRDRLAAEGSARVRRLFDVRRVAADLDDFCADVIERAASRRGNRHGSGELTNS
jgi:glycosyltransferase involved in cell wall biosynthesis